MNYRNGAGQGLTDTGTPGIVNLRPWTASLFLPAASTSIATAYPYDSDGTVLAQAVEMPGGGFTLTTKYGGVVRTTGGCPPNCPAGRTNLAWSPEGSELGCIQQTNALGPTTINAISRDFHNVTDRKPRPFSKPSPLLAADLFYFLSWQW